MMSLRVVDHHVEHNAIKKGGGVECNVILAVKQMPLGVVECYVIFGSQTHCYLGLFNECYDIKGC